MTDADTIAAFLHKIIANPADDGPRLVMADWLEEHGQCERAEYIRVGCELANIEMLKGKAALEEIPVYAKLRRRAHELLTQHEPDWAGEFMPDARWTYAVSDRSFTFRDGGQAIFHWHRGFISQVECTLETWRGRQCSKCIHLSTMRQIKKCPNCQGSQLTGGIGPQLVRRAPVESVVVTDRKPHRLLFCWHAHQMSAPSSLLPRDLFELVCKDKNCEVHGPWADFESDAAANAALSDSMLAEARAALEPSGPRVVQCGT